MLFFAVVDVGHIPTIAPFVNSTSYYCWKGFYLALLQGVVDAKCNFLDYDFQWVVHCHEWKLFQKFNTSKKITKGVFLPYKLVKDVAYTIRPWFYLPFKCEKDGLIRAKTYWNFIQFNNWMVIKRDFGNLKIWWRILLKSLYMSLWNVLIVPCIFLHNMCIIHGNNLWHGMGKSNWTSNAKGNQPSSWTISTQGHVSCGRASYQRNVFTIAPWWPIAQVKEGEYENNG